MDQRRMFRAILRPFAIFWAVSSLHLHAGRQATATASVTAGFVSSILVTDGGAGYQTAPGVLIAGGGGNSASAVALLNADRVSAVVVTIAGTGYSTPPEVTIAPPPEKPDAATLSIDAVPRISVLGTLGTTNVVEWADAVGNPTVWFLLTNFALGSGPAVIIDHTVPVGGRRIYRVVSTTGEPPGRPQGFVWIPPGGFMMGSPTTEIGRANGEIPHFVTLTRGFWMSKTEVSAGEFGEVTKTNPYFETDPQKPAFATWIQATNYCVLLTAQASASGRLPLGYTYRLPTEAEWEYAARAGTTTAYYFGDNPDVLKQFEWSSTNRLAQVGKLRPNPWGLHDMLGNTSEWCWDNYKSYPMWAVTDPLADCVANDWGCENRVFRGSYYGDADRTAFRSAARGVGSPLSHTGFRPVLAPAR